MDIERLRKLAAEGDEEASELLKIEEARRGWRTYPCHLKCAFEILREYDLSKQTHRAAAVVIAALFKSNMNCYLEILKIHKRTVGVRCVGLRMFHIHTVDGESFHNTRFRIRSTVAWDRKNPSMDKYIEKPTRDIKNNIILEAKSMPSWFEVCYVAGVNRNVVNLQGYSHGRIGPRPWGQGKEFDDPYSRNGQVTRITPIDDESTAEDLVWWNDMSTWT